jgi:hypothetical protein
MTLQHVIAIARADASIRMRRVSTVVIFLLLSACAYFWIPDPSTGRTLLQIDGRRALYNSAAIGMATAAIGTIFIGLFGFYVISNAVRRDIDTRAGFLLASTPMRNFDYILGKFLGNVAFLVVFMSGFMATSMAMLLIRGEASLEPFVFMKQYALLVTPTIVFVSAIAILFECIPFLSGRFGDVVYFFTWAGSMGLVAAALQQGAPSALVGSLDFSGFGYLFDQTRTHLKTTHLSIGSSTFDASKPPIIFTGLTLDRAWIIPRFMSVVVLPLGMLGIARLFFHRFDPARIRAGRRSNRKWMEKINALLKPLAKLAFLMRRGAVLTDAMMTFTAAPWIFLVWAGISIAAVANRGSLPIAFALTAIVLADVACRDGRAGTVPLIRSAPVLRERFVWWKVASASIVAFAMMIVPLLRSATPLETFVGIAFLALSATALGVTTANPKTFIVLFLTFWYIVVNDKAATPSLNFGGIHGPSPPEVIATYAVIGFAAVILADRYYAWRLHRGE